jgi:enterochelin esterase-like enzyme
MRITRLVAALLVAAYGSGCGGKQGGAGDVAADLPPPGLDASTPPADAVVDQTSRGLDARTPPPDGDEIVGDEGGVTDTGTDPALPDLDARTPPPDGDEIVGDEGGVPDVAAPRTPGALKTAAEAGDAEGLEALMAAYDGPLCDAVECVVVVKITDHDAVAIRGDWNAWAEEAMHASPLPDWFWATVPVAVLDGCAGYKLYADGDWFRDPIHRWIRFSDVAVNSALCPPGESRIALVEGVYSPQLDNQRSVYVYVPAPAFEDPAATFPVLYMQDGFNVFTNPMAPFGHWAADATTDALVAAGAVEPPIIVGIDTQDRMNEYLYTDITIDIGNGPKTITPLLPEYAEFVVDTVKPMVDAQFPTRPGREDTGIAGSSLGGISSLWIAWFHADTFGRVASFSGSYWVGQDDSGTEGHPTMESLLAAAAPTPDQLALKVYMDSGTDEGMGDTGLAYTGDSRCYTDWTRNALLALGWDNRAEWDDDGSLATPPADFPPESDPDLVPTLYWHDTPPAEYDGWDDWLEPSHNLLHLVGDGHAHNEAAWAARFPAMLRFLYP